MHEQSVLEAKINYLEENVRGLKSDVRDLYTKIDAGTASLTKYRLETQTFLLELRSELKDAIRSLRSEMVDRFAKR